jgi:hypothetical protein
MSSLKVCPFLKKVKQLGLLSSKKEKPRSMLMKFLRGEPSAISFIDYCYDFKISKRGRVAMNLIAGPTEACGVEITPRIDSPLLRIENKRYRVEILDINLYQDHADDEA